MNGSHNYVLFNETYQNMKLPVSSVLDRQGFGCEMYAGNENVPKVRTAMDLLPFMVNRNQRMLMSSDLAQFYIKQNQQIADFIRMERHIHNVTADVRVDNSVGQPVSNFYHSIIPLDSTSDEFSSEDLAISEAFWQEKVSLVVTFVTIMNLGLAALNLYVSLATSSLSVVTSTVDTVLDLLTGTILNITSRAMRDRDTYKYPSGKSRMEPLGILLFSVVMGLASIAIIFKSFEQLITGNRIVPSKEPHHQQLLLYFIVYCVNVVVKLSAVCSCRYVSSRLTTGSSSLKVLATEQSFDLLAYTCAFSSAILAAAQPQIWFFDPVMAILLSCYIAVSWLNQSREHIQHLVGMSAERCFLDQLTYLALRHDSRLLFVDQVRAYHFGERLLVEVHIGLPGDMPLRESHDIGESLQIKIEALQQVEIAHVHTDFEYCHKHIEHKNMK